MSSPEIEQMSAAQKASAELLMTIMQANYAELTRSATSAIEQKKSSAADGSDVIANVMKSMLEQTNKAFDNMTSAASQMTHIANANIQAATTATAKTVGSVTDIVSKK